MNFKFAPHRDDALFVIALLLPAVFAGVRYVESDREVTQLVQARTQAQLAAAKTHSPVNQRLAYAVSGRR